MKLLWSRGLKRKFQPAMPVKVTVNTTTLPTKFGEILTAKQQER